MRTSGCTLAAILMAGQWRSAAFLAYINQIGLDRVRTASVGALSNACLLYLTARTWPLLSALRRTKRGLGNVSCLVVSQVSGSSYELVR